MPSINSIPSANANVGSSLTTQAQKTLSGPTAPGSSSPVAQIAAVTAALNATLKSLGTLSPSALNTSSVKSLTSSLPASMSTTPLNSTNTTLANTKATPSSDPITASLGITPPGTASSGSTFVTSPMQAQVVPINFSPTSNTAAINVAQQNPAQLASVSTRLGVSTPTNDTALAALAATAFVGAAALLTGSTPAATPVLITTIPATSVVVIPPITNQETTYIQTNSSALSSVPNISALLASNWNSSYPLSGTATGGLISGIPGTTDPNIISELSSIASSFCDDFTVPTVVNYASQQSLINTLMSSILGSNLTALFGSFASCPNLFNSETQGIVSNSLPTLAVAGSAALAAAAITAIGPGAVSNVSSLITLLAAQSVPEPNMTTSLNTIMTTTNVPPTVVFGAGTASGNIQVWNGSTISACNNATMAGLIGADTTSLVNTVMSL